MAGSSFERLTLGSERSMTTCAFVGANPENALCSGAGEPGDLLPGNLRVSVHYNTTFSPKVRSQYCPERQQPQESE